ncbi:hypothetical protein B0H16DRAFT_1747960 [Mycena metata]|uniref:Uncharacterized protein n=1 Tax=Mycena metata TaxID=1033252 RepID=A0AAD7GNM5_9AGAR|nr:hypothetical protein B0H16DRAFT_1747960 [Mycena metata]
MPALPELPPSPLPPSPLASPPRSSLPSPPRSPLLPVLLPPTPPQQRSPSPAQLSPRPPPRRSLPPSAELSTVGPQRPPEAKAPASTPSASVGAPDSKALPAPPSSSAAPSSVRLPLEERLTSVRTSAAPPTAPRAMLRPLEERISFAPPQPNIAEPQRQTRPLPRRDERNTVPLYNRLSSSVPLGACVGPKNESLLERLSARPVDLTGPTAGLPESSRAGKRKRESTPPATPRASGSRLPDSSTEEAPRPWKKVRRGRRSGKLVKEYERRKAERESRTEGEVKLVDEEGETQAHLEAVMQVVAEVEDTEKQLEVAWDGEVAPSWAPEEDDEDNGPAKM